MDHHSLGWLGQDMRQSVARQTIIAKTRPDWSLGDVRPRENDGLWSPLGELKLFQCDFGEKAPEMADETRTILEGQATSTKHFQSLGGHDNLDIAGGCRHEQLLISHQSGLSRPTETVNIDCEDR